MYLHKEDRELLHDIIIAVSEKSGLEENIVEKDYYVTLILKELAKRNPSIVFKGGTSLSKAYHVIDRFSEDEEYGLEPFVMRTQSLVRTFIDKLFAVCDYYINGKSARNSRHLYDIYKLYPHIKMDEEFKLLVDDVREHRATMDQKIAPLAKHNVDIIQNVKQIVDTGFYEKDYENSTMKLISDNIAYKEVMECYTKIMYELF